MRYSSDPCYQQLPGPLPFVSVSLRLLSKQNRRQLISTCENQKKEKQMVRNETLRSSGAARIVAVRRQVDISAKPNNSESNSRTSKEESSGATVNSAGFLTRLVDSSGRPDATVPRRPRSLGRRVSLAAYLIPGTSRSAPGARTQRPVPCSDDRRLLSWRVGSLVGSKAKKPRG